MRKGTTGLILVLCIALTLMSGYLVASEYNKQNRKEVFLNEVYFLLKDVHAELRDAKPENLALSAELLKNLTELDVRCILQSQELFSGLSYPRPGVFDRIKSDLLAGVYSQEALRELAVDLEGVSTALSDESGRAENQHLSLQEISRILEDFSRKWGP